MQLFSTGILAEAISMLHRLNISMFYFYEPLQLQIFVIWKFIKTQAFLCLLSLLLSTGTQVAIFINRFVWNIMQYEITFLLKYIGFFICKFDFDMKHSLFFLITIADRKSLYTKIVFSVEYVKIIELDVVYTWRHMQSE